MIDVWVALVVLVLVAAPGAVATVLWTAGRRSSTDGLLRDRLRDRFVVTLTSGESFLGLLAEADTRTVVLSDASVMKPDGATAPVDGELVLRREAIAFMQRPAG